MFEDILGVSGRCFFAVLSDQIEEELGVDTIFDEGVGLNEFAIESGGKLLLRVVDEGLTAGHACGEVCAYFSEYEYGSPGHILASVVTAPFDDADGPGVSDGETFSDISGGEQRAGSGPIEYGISGDGVIGRRFSV